MIDYTQRKELKYVSVVLGTDNTAIQLIAARPRFTFPHWVSAVCAVLSAIENKLLRDVQDARDAGISVDEIIRDLQNKGKWTAHSSA